MVRTVYIGNLPCDITKSDVEELFSECGLVVNTELKTRFAFVEYDRSHQAKDAISRFNRYWLKGSRIKVEHAHGGRYRVLVTGLPPGTTWQQLKDHMRSAGHIRHSDVKVDDDIGTYGIVEYWDEEDMEFSKRLHKSSFRSSNGNYEIYVEEYDGNISLKKYVRNSRSSRSPSSRNKPKSICIQAHTREALQMIRGRRGQGNDL